MDQSRGSSGSNAIVNFQRLLKELDAVIHVKKGLIEVAGGYVRMRCDQKGLSLVDFAELMQHATSKAETYHVRDEQQTRPATQTSQPVKRSMVTTQHTPQ